MFQKIFVAILFVFISSEIAYSQQSQMVLVEEGTGTWCAWCPQGKVFGQRLLHDYPGEVIFIEVHGLDPMTDEEYDDLSQFFRYPSGHINRKRNHLETTYWRGAVIMELNETPPATINVETVYDTSSRNLTVNVSAEVFDSLFGDYRLAAIVVENAVTGEDESYSQKNVFANNNQGLMGGYEILPQTIPYDMMVYDHVGRHLLGGYHGEPESLPVEMLAGNTYSHSFDWTLPLEYDAEYVWIAALLINNENGEVLNAGKSIYVSGKDNAKPFFRSTPSTQAYKDQPYVYDIRYHDSDHDFCAFEIVGPLPSWLSYREGKFGFAALEGMPEEEGTYNVTLRVSDSEYVVEQHIQIVVKDTSIVPPIYPRLVNDFLILPNPNQGLFTIEYDKGSRYQIMDGMGRVVTSGTLVRDLKSQQFSQPIDVEGMNPGVYLLKVFDSYGFSKTRRLLISGK